MSQVFIIIICFLAITAIIYFLRLKALRKPRQLKLIAIREHVRLANQQFEQLTNFEKYFSNWDEQSFLHSHQETRESIKSGFEKLGLSNDYVEELKVFTSYYDQSYILRQNYNNMFIPIEAKKYADFFDKLEEYPLSADQVEAIIRDEDNNLVIAGAGTGKTTTISGKVAYILEKKLALPEELLVISFTKNAVKEMYERCMRFCQHIPEAKKLEVKTFNSYGFLVSRTCSTNEILLAFDGDDEEAKAFLQQQFDELFIHDFDFKRKAVNFLAFFNKPQKDKFEFKNKNDYNVHQESVRNVTIDGIKVKSKEEMEIGNFFCLNGIEYEYQRHYPLKEEDRNPTYGVYQPDFYLPEYELWHEHFGIDKDGNVPSFFAVSPPHETAKETYHAGIAWKEEIHAKYQTRLIKTYSYENHEGILVNKLKEKVIEEGVMLRERSPEELLTLMKKSEQYKDFMDLIYTFLSLMKSNGIQLEQLRPGIDKRFKVFLDVFKPLYKAYESYLKNTSSIDYNDMINHAAEYFRAGKYTKPYKYILVDEFQDMSLGRYKLIQAIRQQNPAVKLYAVGDDWQSIFRFAGSDISIITQFEKQFGVTSQTPVLKTYRFNSEILDTTSNFIQKNPSQIKKKLTSNKIVPDGHVSFSFVKMPVVSGGREQYISAKSSAIKSILNEIAEVQKNAQVFLIGRYKRNAPTNLKALRELFPELTINYHTAHAVKGMTCDYAILLDVDSGTLGFPSEIADDPLLNYLLYEGDSFENAEERRVFYVAITRARYKNYLLYNVTKPSKFLLELMGRTEPDPLPKKCPKCRGQLVLRSGYSDFYGCVHYPNCDGKLSVEEMHK